jgi:asparagine synthase (glutamine-hydrolysing)
MRIPYFEFRNEELKAAVERMNAALRHRGPDDQGIVELRDCANAEFEVRMCLGNTRLAIIDTSDAGHQPMHDPETGNWITYNGETYNFQELRREIGDEFGPWRSHTDTEVVLRAYRKWGVEAFGKLRGMFALAIWDVQKAQLVLARDPFGIKPLYYFVKDGSGVNNGNWLLPPESADSLVFASEVRALFASGLVPRELSSEGVASFLEYGSVQSPRTIIAGVRSLMPGQCLRVSAAHSDQLEICVSQFASFAEAPGHQNGQNKPKSRDEAVGLLRAQVEESVRLHLVSDVPVGVFLSGGMDSSALVALMSRVSKDRPKTFSVVFEEAGFTEAAHSRLVAQRFQTDHCEVHLNDGRLLAMLPQAIASLDQPTIDGINTYVVSKSVKEAGVTLALSGLGADELFAGYPSFRRAARMHSLSDVGRHLLGSFSGAGKILFAGSARRRKFWQLVSSAGTPQDVYRITRQLFADNEISSLTGSSHHTVNSVMPANGTEDVINAVSELELQGYMANTLLRDTDSMSMAHSLEVRVPFVDTAVASYVLPLPGEWKVNGENGKLPKPLLADALRDLLPKDFLMRPKMGFTLPFQKWMQSTLCDDISGVFEDGKQMSSANLNSADVVNVWQKFLRSPESVGWSRPWALYVLAKWCACNAVTI